MTSDDTYPTLDLALRVGELLLSSGAGAADVSVQMQNVCIACGLRGVSASVTFTELQLTHQQSPDDPGLIQVRNVTQREIDYEDLTRVDWLVRDLVSGRIDREEARAALAQIVSSGHERSRRVVTLGWGVMGLGVGLLLGARPIVIAAAFFGSMGIDVIQRYLSRQRLPTFYQQVAGGLFATLLAVFVIATGLSEHPSRIVSAGIILLLAGVSYMGAVQDALTGFPLTAAARSLEATLATAGVIAGVSGGLTIATAVGVKLVNLTPGASAYPSLPQMAIGGAITSAAFAFSSYAPARALLPTGVLGLVSASAFILAYRAGLGVSWPSAIAAVLVGLVSYTIAARIKVPTLVLVVAGVVPLLPGLSIYRGLAHLSADEPGGLVELINASVILLALAAGVIFGEYVAQPLRREGRRLEQRLSGPRLVGPLTVRSARRRKRAAQR
ncbi:threonine/serine exporter family protein [Flexivirga lutea]